VIPRDDKVKVITNNRKDSPIIGKYSPKPIYPTGI